MSNLRSESELQRTPAASTVEARAVSDVAPLILSLDTATELGSVAVVRGTQLQASTRGRVLRENSARVLQDVEAALSAAGVKLDDVELFTVASGPGSFTGLRTGLATIKAFAATLNRPVVGVPTLHAVAAAVGGGVQMPPPPHVVACLAAGRGEVFAQLLSVGGAGGVLHELSEPSHLSPSALMEMAAERWGGDLKWAGAGIHAHAEMLREFANGRGIAWHDEAAEEQPSPAERSSRWTLVAAPVESYAEGIAALGLLKYLAGDSIEAADLEALYVRRSDAELNERCRA